jgi:hypothetical protein
MIQNTEQLLSAFEQLPTAEKIELFEDIVCVLDTDLSRLKDPVLSNQSELLDIVCTNLTQRLEELRAIYGVG